MSIAFDAASNGGGGAVTTLDVPHTCTGSDLVLADFLKCYQYDRVTGVTYNGVPLTQVTKRQDNAGNNSYVYGYILANPSTGTHNITVSLSPAPNVGIGSVAMSYTGCDTTGIPDAFASQSSTSATMTSTVTTTVANCWLVGCNAAARTDTMGSGTTERAFNNTADILTGADSNGAKSAAGSYSLVYTQSDGAISSQIIFSIAPAPASTNVTVNAAVQALTASIPAYSVKKGVTQSPSAQILTASIPAYTLSRPKTVAPAAQSLTFAIPTYVISAGGNLTISPAAKSLTFTIPIYAILFGVTIAPTVQTLTLGTLAASLTLGTGVVVAPEAQIATLSTIAPVITTQRSIIVSVAAQILTFTLPVLAKIGAVFVWTKRARQTDAEWSRTPANDL